MNRAKPLNTIPILRMYDIAKTREFGNSGTGVRARELTVYDPVGNHITFSEPAANT